MYVCMFAEYPGDQVGAKGQTRSWASQDQVNACAHAAYVQICLWLDKGLFVCCLVPALSTASQLFWHLLYCLT